MDLELIMYYVELLILQYVNKDKARETIEALITSIMIYDLAIAVRDGYDIDTAIGAQQDVIGKYIGVSRLVEGIDFTRTYFGYVLYSDSLPVVGISGYANYTDPTPDVQFRQYNEEGGTNLILNDEEYRTVQYFKKTINYSCSSLKVIDDLLFEIFGTDAYCTDGEDMTIEYTFPIDQARIVSIMEDEGFLPKPAGVTLSLNFV